MTTRATVNIFENGNSQALRPLKSYQFDMAKIEILRRSDGVIQRQPRQDLGKAFDRRATIPRPTRRSWSATTAASS